jgi:hypothetical protein
MNIKVLIANAAGVVKNKKGEAKNDDDKTIK